MATDVRATRDEPSPLQDRQIATGSKLALFGAILYFLEWAVIIPAGVTGPADLGTKAAALMRMYAENAGAQELMASWFSLVLLGRIIFVIGVRSVIRQRPRELPLADVAVSAMTVSVVLEVATYGVAAGAAYLAAHGGPAAAVIGLDGAANWTDQIIWAPIGLSIGAAALAMLRSRLFPSWLCWLGLVAGAVEIVCGALAGPAFASAGTAHGLLGAATGITALAAWVWMLATGILLFRRA